MTPEDAERDKWRRVERSIGWAFLAMAIVLLAGMLCFAPRGYGIFSAPAEKAAE